MKIAELNEGPLDALKKAGKAAGEWTAGVPGAVGNAASGTIGALRGGPKGDAQLKKAGAKRAGSAGGQRAKKRKMSDMMLTRWQDAANTIRSEENREPTTQDLNVWLNGDDKTPGFMGGKDTGTLPNDVKDGTVRKYFRTLVGQHYQQKKTDEPEAVPDPRQGTAPIKGKPAKSNADKFLDKRAKNKAVDKKQQAATQEAIAGFKGLKFDNAEIKAMLKRAADLGADPNNAADIMKKGMKESLAQNLMASYLTEAAGKNVHMEHIEDLIFNDGFDGAKAALTYIDQVVAMLSKGSGAKATVTTKWDGAPAIVCGIDPADGRFFVGTKSVFGVKEPKIIKTVKNANDWYREKQPELADKLILSLKQLPKLGIAGVLQGDLMFDNVSSQLETTNINGESMITFTPNTITYAVPAKSDLAATMKRAKMGIVFHTVYQGADMQSMEASFGFNAGSLKKSKDVWADDATYEDLTGTASLTPLELGNINNLISAVEATMAKIRPAKFNVVIEDAEFKKYIKPYINKLVRADKSVGNITEFLNDFFEFYREKMQKEIDNLADPEGRAGQSRVLKIKKQEEFLEDNMNHIAGVLAVFKRLTEIKLLLIAKLHQVEGMGTFIKDGDGYTVTNPEGFVAIGHDGGAVKLVDRLEFSKQNFNAVKQWDKK